MSLTVSAKEYSELEQRFLKVKNAMYSDIQKLREKNKDLHETLEITYKDLEEVMDEKHKLVNHHYQKRLELQEKIDQIKYLWQMIGLEEGNFVLPDDAAIMRQIDEAFQTSIESASLRRVE